MKINKALINNNDVEQYRIPISLGNWLPKAKRKYICGELEKRHPCFSNEFCFFTKDKLSKNGIVSDVFVIEKTKLKNLTKNIYKNNFHSSNNINFNSNRKRRFIIILSSFCLSALIIYLFINNNRNLIEIEPLYEEIHESIITSFNDFNRNTLGKFLTAVENNQGQIRKLRWNLGITGEIITGTIDNLLPEKLEDIIPETKIKSIKYLDKKPFFDFFIENKFVLNGDFEYSNKVSLKNRELLRKKLQELDVEIMEESLNPYRILFSFPIENNFCNNSNLLINLNDFFCKEKIYIKEIDITSKENILNDSKIYMSLILSECKLFTNNILKDISNNLELFIKDRIVKSEIKNKVLKDSNNFNTDNTIIGEVNYTSGKKVIFFRTPDGKIKKNEEYANEKI